MAGFSDSIDDFRESTSFSFFSLRRKLETPMSFACGFCSMMRGLSRRRITVVSAAFTVGVIMLLAVYTVLCCDYDRRSLEFGAAAISNGSNEFSAPHRKLLHRAAAMEEPNRIGGERCSKNDIVISQGPTAPLPSGIPTYTVEIVNACVTGCDISNIHLSCGWFSSARLINPRIFKRLGYDNCLVNDGKPLKNGGAISFQYANTFPYRLSLSSLAC